MTYTKSRKIQVKILRLFRKVHKVAGISLFVFFLFIAVTGALLAWKSSGKGFLLPKTTKGASAELADWKPVNELHIKACEILRDSIDPSIDIELDRIDIRKQKGLVKFVFKHHYWEVQLDGATGDVLQIGRRYSDILEQIHDGSILDRWFGTSNIFKWIYSTGLGLALLMFSVSGVWLWYGPKHLKKSRKRKLKY